MAFPNITTLPHIEEIPMRLFTCGTTDCSVGFRLVIRQLTSEEEDLGVSKRHYVSYCPHHRTIYDSDTFFLYRYVSLLRRNIAGTQMFPVARTHVTWKTRFEYDLVPCLQCQLDFLCPQHLARHVRMYHGTPSL